MFCVVTVRDVQPEIWPEVTEKIRKSFENPPSLRLPGRGRPRITRISRIGERLSDSVLCGTRMRSRFYVNESSFRLAPETSRLAACAPQNGKLAKARHGTSPSDGGLSGSPPPQRYDLLFWATNYLLADLAAATILSKRASPRKGSQHGLKRRSPYVGPAGILATTSSCSSARSRSPVQA
jgi:hypothetical protein